MIGSADLTIARLLQNPLGAAAPDAHPGDIVRVSDGTRTIHLTPREFAAATEAHLRWLLAAPPESSR